MVLTFPTIYTVCPNRILTESGQVDVAAHASIFQDAECQYTTSEQRRLVGQFRQ